MSKYVIYISLPKYLSEWLTHSLGNPVAFPVGSPQNAVIRTFIKPLPDGETPDTGGAGMTAICIPDSIAKPADKYNHITKRGKEAVAETVKDLFLRALWTDINPLTEAPVGINKLIAAWCEAHGIDIDSSEAVRQCFYRIRKEYCKKGINLKSNTRKK